MVSSREKYLIGGMLIVGGLVGIGGYLVWPAVTSVTENIQKKAQLESDVKTLTSQVQINQQMAADLRQVKALPEGVTLRAYRPEALQQNIKSMLDQVMRLASNRGNDLIALEPWDAPLVEPPPPPDPKAPKPATPTPAAAAAAKTGEAAVSPAASQLTTFGYALTLRGSYDSILGFVSSLNNHGELVEMRDITLENESGENRSKTDAPVADPLKPIKMTARLALYLQPEP